MMGIPRDVDKNKENGDGEAVKDYCNNGEERTYQRGEKKCDDMDDDDNPTEYVPEREFQETIHRFEWNNSARDSTDPNAGNTSGSIFDMVFPLTQDPHNNNDDDDDVSMANPTTSSVPLWDDLFESSKKTREKASAEDGKAGLDDLLCLFDDETTDSSEFGHGGCASNNPSDRIDPTILSQGAQQIAKQVISSAPMQEMLEGSYPNWKENIYFALKQTDPSELEQALENVQESRLRLQKEKEEMLKAWESKNAALEVFEKALQASFHHRAKTNPT